MSDVPRGWGSGPSGCHWRITSAENVSAERITVPCQFVCLFCNVGFVNVSYTEIVSNERCLNVDGVIRINWQIN